MICRTPAGDLVNGKPCHLGECRQQLLERLAGQARAETPPELAAAPGNAAPRPAAGLPPGSPAGPQRDATAAAVAPIGADGRRARFAAPAAVLDAEHAYLPGGEVCPWQGEHLGDLAELTSEKTGLRLGCGGGEDRLPDPGQLWLTRSAISALGFPETLDWPQDVDPDEWDGAEKLFRQFDTHPMVQKAREAGWEITSAEGHLRVWTKLRHERLLPRGAHLVFTSWDNSAPTPLTEGDPAPAELADRLARFAAVFGVSYLIGPAITGLRLIDHTRPPRRDADDPLGRQRNRGALVFGQPAQLPEFLRNVDDPRFHQIEGDWLWWRLWEQTPRSQRGALTADERGCLFVHGYDRGASHFAPWQGLDVGLDGLQHRTGPDAVWDGRSEKPGYFLVGPWQWPTWALPNPGDAARAQVEDGRRWVTVHTLKQLKMHGVTPQIFESYTWAETSRYLEPAAKILRPAREHPDPAIRAMAKLVYTRTGGKLAQRRRVRANAHLNRPDWYDHIVSASRTAILYTLTNNLPGPKNPHGAAPLVVDHDAVFYASHEADPVKAWPGNPAKLGTEPGSWKPIGSGDLQTWGPAHLLDQTPMTGHRGFRTWNYTAATADLRRPSPPPPDDGG